MFLVYIKSRVTLGFIVDVAIMFYVMLGKYTESAIERWGIIVALWIF